MSTPEAHASLKQLSTVDPATDAGQATSSCAASMPNSSGTRFRILRPHARGGLGEVFVAHDEELHRDVALKEIRACFAHDLASRWRFVREAEITDGLEHPGIVPVYGLGQYDDGRPFYAMRFIHGDSLQDALRRFHQTDDPSERTLTLHQLLTRFLEVCHALAYAHDQGVIHRDLKPANIMLGPYGETLVVDWGLAKKGGRGEGRGGREEDAETGPPKQGVLPVSDSLPHAFGTEMGQALGTPAYMSPEQAAGRLDELGPASDVYSLGATLYCLLTGRAPFVGSEAGPILWQVQHGEFPRPRQVKNTIPAALEAICLKAMALAPQDRYPTAAALADDLEHWLADEPVSAYPEPMQARLGRWTRRHRPWVAGALALLLTTLVALVLGLIAVRTEQVRTARQRDQAQSNLDLAKKAVDECYLLATKHPLLQDEHLREVRRLLLEKALPYYQNFRGQRQDDADLQAELAENLFRVANITREIGRESEALAAYQEAAALWEQLADSQPQVASYQSELAGTLTNLGILERSTGQREAAARSYHQAQTRLEKLLADYPQVADYQADLANLHNNLGLLHKDAGQREEARQFLDQARQLQEKLVAEHPQVANYRAVLARTFHTLGDLHRVNGQPQQAFKAWEQARQIEEKLIAEQPGVSNYQSSLAKTWNEIGRLQQEMGQKEAAVRSYDQARVLREKLVAELPQVAPYRFDLVTSYANIGVLQMQAGQRAPAAQSLEKARASLEKLMAEHPDVTEYQYVLGSTFVNLGSLHEQSGQREEAVKAYEQGGTLLEKLTAEHPEVTVYQLALSGDYLNLGNVLQKGGQVQESLAWYTKAIARLESLRQRLPDHPVVRLYLRNSHNNRARASNRLGRHGDALADWEQAIALASGPERDGYRCERALLALARAGQHAQAIAEAVELAQGKGVKGGMLYDLACVAALASAAVRRDDKLSSAERDKLAEQHAARAVALLGRANEAGYFKDQKTIDEARKDSDLEVLRSREEFRKWLAELEKKAVESP